MKCWVGVEFRIQTNITNIGNSQSRTLYSDSVWDIGQKQKQDKGKISHQFIISKDFIQSVRTRVWGGGLRTDRWLLRSCSIRD